MQIRIEKYLEDKESHSLKQTESVSTPSSSLQLQISSSLTNTSLSILKQYLSKMIGYHNQSINTSISSTNSTSPKLSGTPQHEPAIVVDHQLEQILRDVEQASEQSLNEMNNLFNEVDIRRKRREIPEYLTCKLCYDLMKDPVITPCKWLCYSMLCCVCVL
jgi:hypothetical protein